MNHLLGRLIIDRCEDNPSFFCNSGYWLIGLLIITFVYIKDIRKEMKENNSTLSESIKKNIWWILLAYLIVIGLWIGDTLF